jgi:carbamoyl-phosphate synthase large subunit
MNSKYNILVIGAGGDIGQSIGKILLENEICDVLVGADIELESAAKFIFNNFCLLPRCTSPEYVTSLEKLVRQFSIDVIIPASEQEIRFFTDNPVVEEHFSDKFIMANKMARLVGLDKLATVEFLKTNGFAFPKTALVKNISEPFYPFILKSRFGSGSKNIFIVDNHDDFNYLKNKYPDFLAQEYISSINQEYTCGLFRSADGIIRHMIMHRRMMEGGQTGYGEVVESTVIAELLEGIAKQFNLRGSINVQLRMSDQGPIVFEINPRISSTVLFRHLLGFHDLIWSIQDTFNSPLSQYIPPPIHSKFYKAYSEYVTTN